MTTDDSTARLAAAMNLGDEAEAQRIYAEIALGDGNWYTRWDAIIHLTDEAVLRSIVDSTDEAHFTREAVREILGGSVDDIEVLGHETYIDDLRRVARYRLHDLVARRTGSDGQDAESA